MKKAIPIFIFLSVFLLFGTAYATPKTTMLFLSKDDADDLSGVTQSETGAVTAFVVQFSGQKRTDENPWFPGEKHAGLALLQLSEVSPCQNGVAGLAPYSGISVLMRTNMEAWTTSAGTPIATVPLIRNSPYSGVTARQILFYMPPVKHVQFLMGGASAYAGATGYLITGLEPDKWPPPQPFLISEHYSRFGQGGVSAMWVSGNTLAPHPLNAAAACVEVQAQGDGIRFTTDGITEPDAAGNIGFEGEDAKLLQLPAAEYDRFWYDPENDGAGTLTILQWWPTCPERSL